ncbi:conserved exported hypothetical protein [uncultured delta proteobacterium]|uniref:BON domain-containing protein n=1 Tax=uncultured delta proteobacterium TaxID=34034 RepID=A0A212IV67_9DELT|nr:conserved exported hypothetical protein [uncultured delta proteobacterium]
MKYGMMAAMAFLGFCLCLSPAYAAQGGAVETVKEGARDAAQAVKESAQDAAHGIGKATSEATQAVGEYVDDAAITAAVKSKFLAQKGLDSMDISVTTSDGVVLLSGGVEHEAQISLAERVAKEVNGVKKIVNNLIVFKK